MVSFVPLWTLHSVLIVPTGLPKASSVSVTRLLPTTIRKEFTDELRGQNPYVPGLWAVVYLQRG